MKTLKLILTKCQVHLLCTNIEGDPKGFSNREQRQLDRLADAIDKECADLVGCLNVTDDTRQELVAHAQRGGELRHGNDAERTEFTRRSGEMFQMLAATSEFQFE